MVGVRIAEHRKRMKLSQAQLAQSVNISASAIGMYEQGRREPSMETLVALSQVMGVSADYLLTGWEGAHGEDKEMAGVLVVLRGNQGQDLITRKLTTDEIRKVLALLG